MSRKSTIILTIAGSAVLAASVVLFIVGAINLNAAKNRGGKGDKKEEKLYALTASGYKTEYRVDEEFTFDGVCYAVYTNSDTVKPVTPTYASPNMRVAGSKVVTLSYTEEDITVTYKYSIAVGEDVSPDPVSDDAKEAAAVELVKTQLEIENKPFSVNYNNFASHYELDFFMSDDIVGREFYLRFENNSTSFSEIFYANSSSTIKRFVNDNFVGYVADLEFASEYDENLNAYSYLRDNYYIPVELNSNELEFVSFNGHNAIFSTESAKINETYCKYTNTEYDAENNRKFYVNLYNEINKVIITPDYSSYADMEILQVNFGGAGSIYDIDYGYDVNRKKDDNSVEYEDYAYIEPTLLPSSSDYDRFFVQPENGNYNNVGSYPSADERNKFTIGFTCSGDAREDYAQNVLLANGYEFDEETGKYTKAYRDDTDSSWEHEQYEDFIHVIELDYVSRDTVPQFSQGVMVVRHSYVTE